LNKPIEAEDTPVKACFVAGRTLSAALGFDADALLSFFYMGLVVDCEKEALSLVTVLTTYSEAWPTQISTIPNSASMVRPLNCSDMIPTRQVHSLVSDVEVGRALYGHWRVRTISAGLRLGIAYRRGFFRTCCACVSCNLG
jgi:hypothetical protein